MKKIKAWLKLLSVNGIGKATAIKIAKTLGEPYSFIYEDTSLLDNISIISDSAKEKIINKEPESLENTLEIIEKNEIKFISILDSEYPESLKNIYDPPPFLFYKGSLKKDWFRRIIAIVGTRKPTAYGVMMTKKICDNLCMNKFTIVSGLAYGIDSMSHQTALTNKSPTFAVLGTSVDKIYPPRNEGLAKRIIETGAVISEKVPGIKTDKWSFPERNRIISGLSSGVVVIEGSKKSGSLITAKFALDQNRDIFALPGNITQKEAEGPNYLIKLGAQIITSPQDIAESYNLLGLGDNSSFPELNNKEEKAYQIIKIGNGETSFDKLLVKTGFSFGELSSIILSLELKNIIKKSIGNKFIALY